MEEWKYVEYATGDKELYDPPATLTKRKTELQTQDFNLVDEFATKLEPLKGLAILDSSLPAGKAGATYSYQLRAWGGEETCTFGVSLHRRLPAGLVLDEQSGLISGTPVQAATWTFSIRVRDSSVARHTGEPQSFVQQYTLPIGNKPLGSKLPFANHPPQAKAGESQTPAIRWLDGSDSSDSDGDLLSYQSRTQIEGAPVTLNNYSAALSNLHGPCNRF